MRVVQSGLEDAIEMAERQQLSSYPSVLISFTNKGSDKSLKMRQATQKRAFCLGYSAAIWMWNTESRNILIIKALKDARWQQLSRAPRPLKKGGGHVPPLHRGEGQSVTPLWRKWGCSNRAHVPIHEITCLCPTRPIATAHKKRLQEKNSRQTEYFTTDDLKVRVRRSSLNTPTTHPTLAPTAKQPSKCLTRASGTHAHANSAKALAHGETYQTLSDVSRPRMTLHANQ